MVPTTSGARRTFRHGFLRTRRDVDRDTRPADVRSNWSGRTSLPRSPRRSASRSKCRTGRGPSVKRLSRVGWLIFRLCHGVTATAFDGPSVAWSRRGSFLACSTTGRVPTWRRVVSTRLVPRLLDHRSGSDLASRGFDAARSSPARPPVGFRPGVAWFRGGSFLACSTTGRVPTWRRVVSTRLVPRLLDHRSGSDLASRGLEGARSSPARPPVGFRPGVAWSRGGSFLACSTTGRVPTWRRVVSTRLVPRLLDHRSGSDLASRGLDAARSSPARPPVGFRPGVAWSRRGSFLACSTTGRVPTWRRVVSRGLVPRLLDHRSGSDLASRGLDAARSSPARPPVGFRPGVAWSRRGSFLACSTTGRVPTWRRVVSTRLVPRLLDHRSGSDLASRGLDAARSSPARPPVGFRPGVAWSRGGSFLGCSTTGVGAPRPRSRCPSR